jgi:hypothetical protein
MYHLNDKDLDRLSKEAAEQYDVDLDPSGWDKLGQKLDRELPVKEDKDRRRWLFFLLLLVCIAGGGMIWFLASPTPAMKTGVVKVEDNTGETTTDAPGTASTSKPGESIASGDQDPQNSKTENKKAAQNDPGPDSKSDDADKTSAGLTDPASSLNKAGDNTATAVERKKNSTVKDKNASLQKTDSELSGIQKQTDNKRQNRLNATNRPGPGLQRNAATVAGKSYPLKNRARGNTAEKNKPSPNKDSESTAVTGKNKAVTEPGIQEPSVSAKHGKADTTIAEKNDLPVTANDKASTNTDPAQNNTPATPDSVINSSAADKSSAGNKKTAGPKKGRSQALEIGLVVAPDFSNVKFNTKSEFGYNIGLQLGYRFSERLSVNTGLIYTRKNYSALGKDFTPPKHNWIYYVDDFKKATGYCTMFEIPLNIRYDVSVNRKRKLFINGGLSSYLMADEYYSYHYVDNGIYYVSRPYSPDESDNYFFSVINFSAGYERALSRQFSLQLEPYIKLPVKGVGFGSINLNSYGIYFSLKYKPFLGKKN